MVTPKNLARRLNLENKEIKGPRGELLVEYKNLSQSENEDEPEKNPNIFHIKLEKVQEQSRY